MGLSIIAGGGLLMSQEYIKQRRKRRLWVGPWIRKRNSKGVYHSILNGFRLTDKKDFRKYLQMIHLFCIQPFCKRPLTAIPILLFYLNKN